MSHRCCNRGVESSPAKNLMHSFYSGRLLPVQFAVANGACTNDQNLHDVVLVLSAAVPRIDFTRSAEDDPSSDSP